MVFSVIISTRLTLLHAAPFLHIYGFWFGSLVPLSTLTCISFWKVGFCSEFIITLGWSLGISLRVLNICCGRRKCWCFNMADAGADAGADASAVVIRLIFALKTKIIFDAA